MKTSKEQPIIFYLDDDVENAIGFKASYSNDFKVKTASNIKEADLIIEKFQIAVFLIDVKMPEEDGVSFALRIKDKFPDSVFILITAYTELELVIDALNHNIFYQFIQKPWNYLHLKSVLYSAYEKYQLRVEKKRLLKDIEASLANEKRANNLKRAFLNNISHEIRTPLNSILGFTECAKNEIEDVQTKGLLDLVYQSGKELLDTFDNVLDASIIMTKQMPLNLSSFNASEVVNEVISDKGLKFGNARILHVENNVDQSIYLYSDKILLKKILNNLVDNAIAYSSNGEVKIMLYQLEATEWQFEVWNKGYSDLESKERILFAPFKRGKTVYANARGSGMGLFNAKAISDLLGGKLSFSSSAKKDTSFFFSFKNPICS